MACVKEVKCILSAEAHRKACRACCNSDRQAAASVYAWGLQQPHTRTASGLSLSARSTPALDAAFMLMTCACWGLTKGVPGLCCGSCLISIPRFGGDSAWHRLASVHNQERTAVCGWNRESYLNGNCDHKSINTVNPHKQVWVCECTSAWQEQKEFIAVRQSSANRCWDFTESKQCFNPWADY